MVAVMMMIILNIAHYILEPKSKINIFLLTLTAERLLFCFLCLLYIPMPPSRLLSPSPLLAYLHVLAQELYKTLRGGLSP